MHLQAVVCAFWRKACTWLKSKGFMHGLKQALKYFSELELKGFADFWRSNILQSCRNWCVLLFRSLVLVCSRDVADVVGSSEMSVFTKLGSAKPIVFHKEGKCMYSTMFVILKNYWCVSLRKVYTYLYSAYQYISYHTVSVKNLLT